MATGQFGISQHVTRREDARLITGGGNYADDANMNRQAFAAFLRSPVGHADITGIDVSAAAAAPGVISVYVGEDLKSAGVGPIPSNPFSV